MEPYLAPGQTTPQKMKLIGIISHQGTKNQGHYVAITNRGNVWTSYNDAVTAQTTLTQLHQTQAYIMIYRKMDHNEATGINEPRDSTMADQQLPAKKFKPSHKHSIATKSLRYTRTHRSSSLRRTSPAKKNQTVRSSPNSTPYMKKDLPRRTWRYSKPSLVIVSPHRPQKPGGGAKWKGQQNSMEQMFHLLRRQTLGRHH